MGLDTSHGCWHGAYSAFMRWRRMIARVAGMPPLDLMQGFFERDSYSDPLREYAKQAPELADLHYRSLPIQWEALKPDPLHILLCHSDYDGQIEAKDCGPIADSLEKLMPLLPSVEAGGHIGDWRDKTQAFIDGLRAAAAAGENVEFH